VFAVLVRGGIPDGALIVTKGVQMLYPGQSVIAIAPTTAGAYQL
jgi:hypothetical protein